MAMVLPQVEQNTLPLVQAQAPESKNFAAAQAVEQGQALQHLGEAAIKIEDMRANAAATQSDNELVSFLQSKTTEYNQLHGEEAVKAKDAFIRLAQNKADEIKARSTSPLERDMVNRVFAQRLQSFNGHIDTSYIGQLDKWEKGEASGRVTLAGQNLYNQWASYGTPAFTDAKAQLDARITEYAKREGLGADATAAYRIKELTGQHKQILGAMMSNSQAEMAKEYLKAHINEIETDDRAKLQDIVKKAGAEQKGMNDAMEAKARFLNGEKFDAIMEDYFKKYGGGDGGKLDTDTFKVFRAQFTADRGDVEKTWHDEALLLAMPVNKAILERESQLNRRLTPKELTAVPQFTQMRMSNNPKAVEAANKIYDEVTREYTAEVRFNKSLTATTTAAAKQAKADQLTVQSSLTLAKYAANPQMLVGLTDAQKAAVEVSLDKAHRGQWKTLVEHTTSPKALTTLELNQQEFDNVFKAMGWTDKKKIAEGRNAATAYLLNQQREQGYHFDKAKAREAVAAGVMEVEVKKVGGSWFTSTMKVPFMNVKYKGNIVIPKDDKELIAQRLKDAGIANPTTEDVADAYSGLLAERGADKVRGLK